MKVKPYKTADAVIVGIRWKNKPDNIATLLLGLYRDDGGLDYVGSAAVAASKHDQIAEQVVPLIDKKSDRRFSEPNRWGTGDLEEQAVKPKLVAEVRYDKVQGNRFRHGTGSSASGTTRNRRTARGARSGLRATRTTDLGVASPSSKQDCYKVRDGATQETFFSSHPPPVTDCYWLSGLLHRRDGSSGRGLDALRLAGIFGNCGGYGASPMPSFSSRSTHSKSFRRSQTASSIPAWTSPSFAKRLGIVAIVKSSVSTSGSSSQVTGAETVASGRARTE